MPGGELERAVRSDLAAVVSTAPFGEALAELALTLADLIDGGQRCHNCGTLVPGSNARAVPALSAQLRAVLSELATASVGDDDDLAAVLSRVSDMPTAVRHSPEP